MSFDSLQFVIFFLVTFLVYWRLKGDGARRVFLSAASFFFYAYWDWRYLALMVFVVIVAYVVALRIAASGEASVRKRWVVLGIALHLGVLCFFKYVDFFIGSLNGVASVLGMPADLPLLKILLPVGISFYTFHAISYTVDVYRGVVTPVREISRIALYISFFPQLIAGPIVRSSFFLPQMAKPRPLEGEQLALGVRLFVTGFIYKSGIADNLALICDPVFQAPTHWSAGSLWIAAFAYYGQIYFDFAGYSLMAIGCAWWFGYELPNNFRWPYSSSSVTEFWKRWHISLSSWLRDYLYIPLGGKRQGIWLQNRNLMLTMLLGGLWHGAAWHFVIWGAMHGLALVVHKAWSSLRGGQGAGFSLGGWLLTQLWVFVAWIFFRSESWQSALDFLVRMLRFDDTAGLQALPGYLAIVVFAVLLIDTGYGRWAEGKPRFALPGWSYAVIVGCLLSALLVIVPLSNTPFIYFQF